MLPPFCYTTFMLVLATKCFVKLIESRHMAFAFLSWFVFIVYE